MAIITELTLKNQILALNKALEQVGASHRFSLSKESGVYNLELQTRLESNEIEITNEISGTKNAVSNHVYGVRRGVALIEQMLGDTWIYMG